MYIPRLSFHVYHFLTVRDHIENLALTFTQYGNVYISSAVIYTLLIDLRR